MKKIAYLAVCFSVFFTLDALFPNHSQAQVNPEGSMRVSDPYDPYYRIDVPWDRAVVAPRGKLIVVPDPDTIVVPVPDTQVQRRVPSLVLSATSLVLSAIRYEVWQLSESKDDGIIHETRRLGVRILRPPAVGTGGATRTGRELIFQIPVQSDPFTRLPPDGHSWIDNTIRIKRVFLGMNGVIIGESHRDIPLIHPAEVVDSQ